MGWDLGDLNFGAFGRAAEVGAVGSLCLKVQKFLWGWESQVSLPC